MMLTRSDLLHSLLNCKEIANAAMHFISSHENYSELNVFCDLPEQCSDLDCTRDSPSRYPLRHQNTIFTCGENRGLACM